MRDLFEAVDELTPEMLDFAMQLIAIPTVNPPGEHYRACADLIASRLRAFDFRVDVLPAEGHSDHSVRYPRWNVIASRQGMAARPAVHFNGHIDVVPPGAGWT